MKTKTLLLYLLNCICLLNFTNGQSTIDLTQATTSINAGIKSVVDTMNNQAYTYTIGQISGRALIRPDQSYEIGFIHCNACKIINSKLPDLSAFIKVYPSPTKNTLTIESEYPSFLSFKLHSTSGQVLISRALHDKELLEISHLPEGLYLLIFYDKSGKTIWFEKISKL